jgi:hypothetical protein
MGGNMLLRVLAGILVILLVDSAVAAEPTGAQTPQEAFDKFGAAVKKKDYQDAMKRLTSDSQDALLGMMAMGLSVVAATDPKVGAEGDEILTKHKVKKFDISKISTKPPNDRRVAAREVGADVNDKPAALAELLRFEEKNSTIKGMPQLTSDGLIIDLADGQLKDLKVDGNGAVASVKLKKNDESQPIKFEKTGGVWLIDFLQ